MSFPFGGTILDFSFRNFEEDIRKSLKGDIDVFR